MEMAVDRAGRAVVVSPQPRALARAVRSARRRRRTTAADRAAPSDRVLRRPPAGLQLQHAGEEGARRARASTRASRRCSRAASIRDDEAQASRQRQAWRGRRATRCARSPTKPIARVIDALVARASSIGRAIRCSIAPRRCSRILEHEAMHQETLLYMWHRLPFDAEAPAGRLRAARRRRAAAPRMDRDSRRAARRSASTAAPMPFGWDNEFPALRGATCRRSRSSATT